MAEFSRRDFIKGGLLASTAVGAGLSFPNVLRAQETVKIGYIDPLSGGAASAGVSAAWAEGPGVPEQPRVEGRAGSRRVRTYSLITARRR